MIISCSNLPLSIIIVGIGNANFDNMNRLDGDGGLYGSKGQTAQRDIVQFVPFNEFLSKGPIALAEEVLKEVPNQVLGYMNLKKFKPNKSK